MNRSPAGESITEYVNTSDSAGLLGLVTTKLSVAEFPLTARQVTGPVNVVFNRGAVSEAVPVGASPLGPLCASMRNETP